jgi:hypothetical protein
LAGSALLLNGARCMAFTPTPLRRGFFLPVWTDLHQVGSRRRRKAADRTAACF